MASIVLVGFIAYANFSSSNSSPQSKYILMQNDTINVLNDNNPVVDSILEDVRQPLVPVSTGSLMVDTDSSVFIDGRRQSTTRDTISADSFHVIEERSNLSTSRKVKAINEEAQTWFRLIIDFFETVSPLLGPIVSYYFVRRERKKSDQTN